MFKRSNSDVRAGDGGGGSGILYLSAVSARYCGGILKHVLDTTDRVCCETCLDESVVHCVYLDCIHCAVT